MFQHINMGMDKTLSIAKSLLWPNREGVKKGKFTDNEKSVSTYLCRDGNFLSIAKSVSVVTCLIQQF